MKTKILLFVLCISFINRTYQCQCPSYKAPPKEIPKNIDSTYNNVVGYNGLIYYKGTVKEQKMFLQIVKKEPDCLLKLNIKIY